ncbi:MAG: hypothetical protein MJ213_02905, partial [Bacilli bacterium]|nr:hypothetical protein [Bacilli bacterium]
KEEFKKLLKKYYNNLIQSYELTSKSKYYDYYVVDRFPLTEEQVDSNKYGTMYIIKYEEIPSLIQDSLNRIYITYPYKDNKAPDKFIENLKKHNIKDKPDDFYHGYIQGVNCAIQYLRNTIEFLGMKPENLFNGDFLNYIS